MKSNPVIFKSPLFLVLLVFLSGFLSCKNQTGKKTLTFIDYPNLKIGFSTQNFQKAMPNTIENLTEIIEYATREGFQFIELRDDLASLTISECKALAEIAGKNKIEVIYEIQKNLLDTGYFRIFEKGLNNTLCFPEPGILRTMISKSEFAGYPAKKGWTSDEIVRLARIADSCAMIAEQKNIRFLIENFDEAYFGDTLNYFGLSDFFVRTSRVGLQFDISNPFRKSSREKAEPGQVARHLVSLGPRWVSSHLKTIKEMGGEMQPVLTESPLPVEKVIALMGEQRVTYAALELAAVSDKQECFKNHNASIQLLKDIGILRK
jgi:sugar phosphate isomerase/epimerase